MTNTLTISREQLERWLVELKSSTAYATRKELQSILAAPAVERQAETIYQVRYLGDGGAGWSDVDKDEFDLDKCRAYYQTRTVFASPPAPVAVDAEFLATFERVLLLFAPHDLASMQVLTDARACLDKVKEMNR
jgi:hypothetical protein